MAPGPVRNKIIRRRPPLLPFVVEMQAEEAAEQSVAEGAPPSALPSGEGGSSSTLEVSNVLFCIAGDEGLPVRFV